MSWYSFRPYVSVAERRRKAEATAKKMAKSGRALEPIDLPGRTIASTFWGKAWCDNLESYSDYENRLPRGRTYVRNGSVIDLQIHKGKVEALVQGSDLYQIEVGFKALPPKRWKEFKKESAGKVTNLLDLLQGRLSKEILASIAAPGAGLFPSPKEITLNCSCPDWATMCKHVAAVLYGVGARLDEKPELFFTLRGVDMEELLTAASASAVVPQAGAVPGAALAGADLSEIFGVEIEAAAPAAPSRKTKPKSSLKPKPKAVAKPNAKAKAKAGTKAKVAAKPATRKPTSPKAVKGLRGSKVKKTAPAAIAKTRPAAARKGRK